MMLASVVAERNIKTAAGSNGGFESGSGAILAPLFACLRLGAILVR